MRGSLSILMVLFFGLGPLSATLEGSDDASLPACCRRHGAHHCAMSIESGAAKAQPSSSPTVSAPVTCPYYPGTAAAVTGSVFALVFSIAHLPVTIVSAYRPLTASIAAVANPSRTHAGRGPPQIS